MLFFSKAEWLFRLIQLIQKKVDLKWVIIFKSMLVPFWIFSREIWLVEQENLT